MDSILQSLDSQEILNNISDGVVIVDSGGKTIWANEAWDRITGLDRAQVLGRRMADVVGEGFYDQSVTEALMKTGRTTTVDQTTVTGKYLISTGMPVFEPDPDTGEARIRYIVICMRDITMLKNTEKQLRAATRENRKILEELEQYKQSAVRRGIIAKSKAMRDVIELAERVARVDSTVLITGESGVGKGVVARHIHDAAPGRREGPFVQINCGAIPPALLESELFGYESGAFTGAKREGKPGLYETAHKGTLFLDEIGEFPLELQAKLLHVLQERSVTRVGGTRARTFDVRIVAATNQDLEALVEQKKFRADLYYRLAVVPICIPSLRQRREDILPLAAHYLEKYNRKYALSCRLTEGLLDRLTAYDWPGNVRELSNAVERMVVTADGEFLTADQMDFKSPPPAAEPAPELPAEGDLRKRVSAYEKRLIAEALRRHGTQAKAAQALGVSLSTLLRKQ